MLKHAEMATSKVDISKVNNVLLIRMAIYVKNQLTKHTAVSEVWTHKTNLP